MHARYYSAFWGRFTSVDPIPSGTPQAPQTANKYSYVTNNPLKYRDPEGSALEEAWDFYSWQQSSQEWAQAFQAFVNDPSLETGATAAARFLENAVDSAALLVPGVPAAGGLLKGARYLDKVPMGFARGTAASALESVGRVDHASRHLIDAGVLGDVAKGSNEARKAFRRLATQVLENPQATFNSKLRGNLDVKVFVRVVNGKRVAIAVAKAAKGKIKAGDVVTAVAY